MNITCKYENEKTGEYCERPAIAMVHDGDERFTTCHFHTNRAGMAKVMLLDDVLGLLLEQNAIDLSRAILTHLTHLSLEERANISAAMLTAYAIETEVAA